VTVTIRELRFVTPGGVNTTDETVTDPAEVERFAKQSAEVAAWTDEECREAAANRGRDGSAHALKLYAELMRLRTGAQGTMRTAERTVLVKRKVRP
jgi:hypothetical protein